MDGNAPCSVLYYPSVVPRAFFVVEQKIMKGGVCNFVDSTIITLFGVRIHFIVVFECISIFVIVLLMGIVKDCYSYENRIAAIAAIIGGNAKKVQEEIRRRWAILDEYCPSTPKSKRCLWSVGTHICGGGECQQLQHLPVVQKQ